MPAFFARGFGIALPEAKVLPDIIKSAPSAFAEGAFDGITR